MHSDMQASDFTFRGFQFPELLTQEGIARLDQTFLDFLEKRDAPLYRALLTYREVQSHFNAQTSDFLIQLASQVETFLVEHLSIQDAAAALQAATLTHVPLFAFKKYYVLREARRALKKIKISHFYELHEALLSQLSSKNKSDLELAIASYGQQLLQDTVNNEHAIQQLIDWCVAAMTTQEGQAFVKNWVSFKIPRHLDYQHLVPTESVAHEGYVRLQGPDETLRQRDGFALTDKRMNARQVQEEIHYCVYCHEKEGDFCSRGFPVKKTEPKLGLKINPLNEILTGCPLEEKISEMHVLKRDGHSIAALAMVMRDNPMCPATGHRICNDCMKACIYQKQDPVNVPQIETRVLTDVLQLPWGVEIYDLLTRWNPLRHEQYMPKPYNGLKILVMGMGPAGFTLAHHLLMEGFAIVGAEGLKLEPLPHTYLNQPIKQFSDICEALDERIMAGFGGVAEYGITVRWDKNFLKLIYLTLMRREYFHVVGNVRFGGTLTVEDAWNLGFNHLTIAVGAGLPRELPVPNSMAPGMRQANDFLMALQLTGASKKLSLANLQVRLPAIVIGGGLTGIDTATEVQAYYLVQIEKTLLRYEKLIEKNNEAQVRQAFNQQELEVLDEFCTHANHIREERMNAKREQRPPNFVRLLRQWGGVSVVYRRQLQESPAYQRNHEEVIKALEEGIYYIQGLQPVAVETDQYGWVNGLTCGFRQQNHEGSWGISDKTATLPARSIYVATGAKPNVAYEFEHRGTFSKHQFQYERFTLENNALHRIDEIGHVKKEKIGIFTSYKQNQHYVSFIGDTHPIFHGSVVKAIASAKRSYPLITAAVKHPSLHQEDYLSFKHKIEKLFTCKVHAVKRHAKDVVELTIYAPMAARKFHAGQFYRLQSFETHAPRMNGTPMHTEGIALIGIYRESAPECLSFMVIENGTSTQLITQLEIGAPIALMGPTGAKVRLPEKPEHHLIIGDRLAIAHFLSVAPALKKTGTQSSFMGCFEHENEIYCRNEIDALAQQRVFCSPTELDQKIGEIDLTSLDCIVVVGSTTLLKQWRQLQQETLAHQLRPNLKLFAAVYAPMQCMLKGVCAQCLQWQIDPVTGERTKAVYACSWQNQPADIIDIQNIHERLVQNSMQEKLTNLWVENIKGEKNNA